MLARSLLVGSSLAIAFAGLLWGTLYFVFDEPVAGTIPYAYSALSLLSLAVLQRTRSFEFYRVTQLVLILLLPFFLMIALGGFVNSSSVILWSAMAPFGAILFARARETPWWIGAYLGLVVIGGLLHPLARESNNLPGPLVVPVFFMLNIGAVSGITLFLVYYFVRERNRAYALLDLERERSERLLLNVLPVEIAARLKEREEVIADHVESASVLFADIIGSTPLFARLDPEEIVELLNDIFSRFDRLVERHDLEKIRTIGDNYMVCAGTPVRRVDHALAITRLALDMCNEMRQVRTRDGAQVGIRVGINSGPLVAGVIGKTKFHYDIWGDTVNTASRMESHGEAGRIQITRNTYELVKDHFECEYRGAIEVKGKGEIETWFVVGERQSQSGGRKADADE